jgi:competence protein ComEC
VTSYPGLVLALAWSTAIAAAVVLIPEQPVAGVIAAGATIPLLALAIVMRPALLAAALAVAMLAVARVELPPADAAAAGRAASLVGATAVLSGRVTDDARAVGGGGEVLVAPSKILVGQAQVAGVGNLLVRWRGPSEPAFGDVVVATGKLVLPRNMPDFDRRAYLGQRQVYLELQASNFDVKSSGAGIGGVAAWLRARYTEALNSAVDPPHAAMLMGIVLGIKHGIPTELEQALIATGLIHLLVLSGLKVAVFARIVQAALSPLLGRRATWPVLGLIALYCLVGGATPAAVRASAMGGLALAATHLGRPSHVWTSLAITAAAMLGWSPELAWDVGFQLSFAGTAAIILLTPAIARRVAFIPHVLREPFAVTCAAQVGTLPMMATDFHVLSPIAPVANALTLPILPVLIGAGLLLSVLGFAPDIAHVVAIPITGLLAYVEQVGYVLARVPGAAFDVPSFPTWMGLAYYSSLGPAIAGAHTAGQGRNLAYLGAAAAPILISIASLAMWAYSPPQAYVLNVGDGQAVLLRGPHGAVLIDGGPSPEKLRDELGRSLPPWQRTLDAIVITAPGLGHVGGLSGFDRAARTIVIPDPAPLGVAWRNAALEQVARGAVLRAAGAGATIKVAGFQIEVLSPEQGMPREETGAAQLGFRAVSANGKSFCDFSDLDLDAQTLLASRLPSPCTYILIPSGGRSRLSPDLERAAIDGSTQLVVSRGPGRLAAGFPPDVLRTDEEGTITLPL